MLWFWWKILVERSIPVVGHIVEAFPEFPKMGKPQRGLSRIGLAGEGGKCSFIVEEEFPGTDVEFVAVREAPAIT